jgi:hypothetical protein
MLEVHNHLLGRDLLQLFDSLSSDDLKRNATDGIVMKASLVVAESNFFKKFASHS